MIIRISWAELQEILSQVWAREKSVDEAMDE